MGVCAVGGGEILRIIVIFNRPGEARAVLQTPPLLINSVSQSCFVKISSLPNGKCWEAELLREGSPPPTCHV